MEDYKETHTDENAITIWVNWGRDQAQILNDLIRDDFKQKTGIDANISVVNATLIQAILSGNGPGCFASDGAHRPVELRHARSLV